LSRFASGTGHGVVVGVDGRTDLLGNGLTHLRAAVAIVQASYGVRDLRAGRLQAGIYWPATPLPNGAVPLWWASPADTMRRVAYSSSHAAQVCRVTSLPVALSALLRSPFLKWT